jgi:hypothetical protein
VEKQQRAQGLRLGGRREVSLHHQITQELPHLGGAQFGGVPEATETDEPLGPVDLGGFGAPAQRLEAQVGLQRWPEGRLVLHSGLREMTPAISGSRSPPPGSLLSDWGPNNAAADEVRSGRCRRPAARNAIGPLLPGCVALNAC